MISRYSISNLRGTFFIAAVTIFAFSSIFIHTAFATDKGNYPIPAPNPALSNSCGFDISLVIDSSGSIDNQELKQSKNAFKGFVGAFIPATPTLFSVVDFGTTASVLQPFTDEASLLNIAINAPTSGGYTNWEDGLTKAFGTFDPRNSSEHQNLIFLASDGDTNRPGPNESEALKAAIIKANQIKNSGTRIITLAIGNNLELNNLKAISSADAVYYTSDFKTLADDLLNIASSLCGGTITVKKLIDNDANLATTDDQLPAADWTFDIDGAPSNPSPEVTGIDGYTSSVEVRTGVYKITETIKPNFELISASCSVNNIPVGNATENGVENISITESDIVSCVFINHQNHIPVITINGPNPDNILVSDGSYTDPGYSASDIEDGDLTGSVVVGGDVMDTTTVGIYIITYDVLDSSGASAEQKTRTVKVSSPPSQCADGVDNDDDGLIDYPEDPGCQNAEDDDENSPPVITAGTIITLTLGSIFDPLNYATVVDDEDDPEPILIVGGDFVDTSIVGDYLVTYDATDSAGAIASQKTLTVQVRAQCGDSLDNDTDTFVDANDPGCHSDGDVENLDSYDSNDNDETNPLDVCPNLSGIQITIPDGLVLISGDCVPPLPACSDGIDNDEDLLVDIVDPGCHSDGNADNPDSYDPNDGDETDVIIPVDIVINLSADPSAINKGQSSTLTWTSTNATVCMSDWTSATSTSGTQVVTPENTTDFVITCGNNTATSTATTTVTVNIPTSGPTPTITACDVDFNSDGIVDDQDYALLRSALGTSDPVYDLNKNGHINAWEVVIFRKLLGLTCENNIPTPPTPTGGGGGSSRSGSYSAPVVLLACPYLKDYMRIDFANDPLEVLKLQSFLISFERETDVSLTGVFDQATLDAVNRFQVKYFNDVLEPWGHTGPTGYVYITTLKKINEIYCNTLIPLSDAQIDEIVAFRAFLESLKAQGINPQIENFSPSGSLEETDIRATTTPLVPIVGEAGIPSQNQNLRNLAAAIFATPNTLTDIAKSLAGLGVLLIALYVVGNVLKDVFYKDIPVNSRKRFLTKWLTVDTGLGIAVVATYVLGWLFILPLLIALILSLTWTTLYPEHNSIRASLKSWYLVGLAWFKSSEKQSEPIKIKSVETPRKEHIKEPIKEELQKEFFKKESTEKVIFMGPKK